MPTITRTAEVKTRTTAQIKADAAAVYARWGISLSDAINIFLAKSIEVGGLPFDMRPETPTFDGLERYAYRPTLDVNGVARLPGDWDDGEWGSARHAHQITKPRPRPTMNCLPFLGHRN